MKYKSFIQYYCVKKMADPLLTDLFLDNESVSTINRAVSDIVVSLCEENEFYTECNSFMKKDTNINDSEANAQDIFEETISGFTEKQFKENFKMSRETMKKLIDFLKNKCKSDVCRMIVPFEKKVHILLYTLANKESFKDIGKVFNLHKSSTSIIFHEMCTLVTESRFDLIKWPSSDEKNVIKQKVKTFPNCVGFIDCWHFQIKTPGNNPVNSHLSKKPEYTVILQAVCDNTLKFTDIYLGETGKLSAMRVFQSSPLCEELDNLINYEDHILGDSDYPLKVNLMTPFRDNGNLSDAKREYNKAHAATRVFIRRAFGRLRAKFRRLKFLDVKKVDTAIMIICAACALHNFILLHEPDDITDEDNDNPEFNLEQKELNAESKRELISSFIYNFANT